ncbi:GntR family transcriptional regulator [Phragmitibacter flavus]|uniref:GntR family transcriptional regulator n=1 Tax=Phragmitibacter flavus TaxID=2576071 RepID=A0A5R8KCG2_9BACT|nr:GntR family transcriptional regulator [Phragmitibacter flavus]TLD69927.1 GntR family transcriptional regulator [Phragmitibacter flavus]
MSFANSLSSQAYQHIQRKLLSGAWNAGDVISEQSVAQEMGISRTPVREAIRHLEQEGVLEQVPRFGTRVKALDRRDLVELYELRDALEPYAVAQVAGKLEDEDVKTLGRLCDELKNVAKELRRKGHTKPDAEMMKRLMSADMAFHHLLIRAAGNGRLMKIVAEGRVLARIFSTSRQEHDLEVIEQTLRYHLEIVEAVVAGDGEAARRLMSQHIRASMGEALEHFDRQQALAQREAMSVGLPEAFTTELEVLDKTLRPPKTRT